MSLFLLALASLSLADRAQAQRHERRAPFEAIRWPTARPEVRIGTRWYALQSIDTIRIDELVAFAKKRHGNKWQKRCNEDLVQVMTEMGKAPGKTVKLGLVDLDTGKARIIVAAPMTEANRRAIWRAGRPAAPRGADAVGLRRGDLAADLSLFTVALTERWSYREASEPGINAAIAALRKRVDAGIATDVFGVELQKIIALGVDGHAGIRGLRWPPGRTLPFLIEPAGKRFVAFLPDRSAWLDKDLPYVTKIEGKTIAVWCQAASVLAPRGSTQYQRRHALRHLRQLDHVRELMGLPIRPVVEVEIESPDGKTRKILELATADRTPIYGRWPRGATRMLEGDVAYLRLPQMDSKAVLTIRQWMPRFAKAKGLIVDVRDNGGGSRSALRHLYRFLVAPESSSRVFTAAVYRLHAKHAKNHLEARFMYRAQDERWSDKERAAIAAFAKAFRPEWTPPKEKFSAWHYMVLRPSPGTGIFHFKKPVVVLMNAKCFSATDIFLAGLKGLPGVTLIGSPSGGGSARSQSIRLPASGLELRIGSMASFQADGKLFDGRGIQPDALVNPSPSYFIGGKDDVLEEAIRRIQGR